MAYKSLCPLRMIVNSAGLGGACYGIRTFGREEGGLEERRGMGEVEEDPGTWMERLGIVPVKQEDVTERLLAERLKARSAAYKSVDDFGTPPILAEEGVLERVCSQQKTTMLPVIPFSFVLPHELEYYDVLSFKPGVSVYYQEEEEPKRTGCSVNGGERHMMEGKSQGSKSSNGLKRKQSSDSGGVKFVSIQPGVQQPGTGGAKQSMMIKKPRIQWDRELHALFVDAVDKSGGVRAAMPKQVLQLMMEKNPKQNLNRESIASHLQKYREKVRLGIAGLP